MFVIVFSFKLPLLHCRILEEFIIRNRMIFDEKRGLVRECKTPQKSDAELKKYLIKKKAVVEESDTEMSVEEVKPPPSKKAAAEKKPKAQVGRKRKLPVRLDTSSASSDSEDEVVIQKPAPRPKRIAGTAALAGTITISPNSAVAVASPADVAPLVAVASDISVSDAMRSASVTVAARSDSISDAAHSAAPAATTASAAAEPFQVAAVSNAPANVPNCLLPRNSALPYLPIQTAAFEGTKMDHPNAFQATAYVGVPGATYADSMSDLICDSIFYKMEIAQQKIQIEEFKRREEERRASEYVKAVQAEGRAAFKLHLRQMFGGNNM